MLKARFQLSRDAGRSVIQRIKEIAGLAKRHEHRASVGIHEEQGHAPKVDYGGESSAISLIEDAVIHEFGAGNAPDRSFVRTWFDSNLARLKREAVEAMRREYAGDGDAVAKQAADWGRELSAWVTSGEAGLAPLAPSTIVERERAGLSSGPPLFATGQLAEAIRAMVDGAIHER